MSTQTDQQQETAEVAEGGLLDGAIDTTLEAMMRSPELLQMRMDNETIMTECRVRPRDLAAIKAELEQQLKAFPGLAEAAIYCKPVGKGKFAEGLSVRAAEALAEAYGYNRVQSEVTPIDRDTVKVSASFVDYQKGRVWRDSGPLSIWYKSKYEGRKRWDDDRFYNVVAKAEASKRIREVILRSVNAGLKAWFENECRKVVELTLDDDRVNEIVKSFRGIGVGLEELETLVGRPKAMGWLPGDRQLLLGIWNAIEAKETTVDTAFGRSTPSNDHAEQAAAAGRKAKEAANKSDDGPAGFDRTKRMKAFRTRITKAKGSGTTLADVICDVDADPELAAEDIETLKGEITVASQKAE